MNTSFDTSKNYTNLIAKLKAPDFKYFHSFRLLTVISILIFFCQPQIGKKKKKLTDI